MSYCPEASLVLHGSLLAGFSDDAFFNFCQVSPDLRIERNARGEIVLTPPPVSYRAPRASKLPVSSATGIKRLNSAGWPTHRPVHVLPDEATLSPDAPWVSRAKLANIPVVSRRKSLRPCPEFVAEVLSPTDHLADAQAKIQHWLATGVQLGFLLTDEPDTAYLYRPAQLLVEAIDGFDQELSGEPVLPGFQLDWRELREAQP